MWTRKPCWAKPEPFSLHRRWADEIIAHLPPAQFDLFNMLGVEDADDWDDEPPAAGACDGASRLPCTCLACLLAGPSTRV